LREKEQGVCRGGGGERERESYAGSTPSVEPDAGLDLTTLRWPEPKSRVRRLTDWAAQRPNFAFEQLFRIVKSILGWLYKNNPQTRFVPVSVLDTKWSVPLELYDRALLTKAYNMLGIVLPQLWHFVGKKKRWPLPMHTLQFL